MFESAPKNKRANSDRDIDQRLAGYLEELTSTRDGWFREGSFQSIDGRMRLVSRALDETRKILVVDNDHDWGERERRASTVSLALSEEYNNLSVLKEGFAQKQEIEKQKGMPTYAMRGAVNPFPTEPRPHRTAAKTDENWDFLK